MDIVKTVNVTTRLISLLTDAQQIQKFRLISHLAWFRVQWLIPFTKNISVRLVLLSPPPKWPILCRVGR